MVLGRYIASLAQTYLFKSTLATVSELREAESISDVAAALIESAASGGQEFWMDLFLIAAVLLVVVMFATCLIHIARWIFVGLPREARDAEEIRQGKKEYQVKAKREREEKARRVAEGKEEKPVPVAEDMKKVAAAMAEMRGDLAKHGVPTGAAGSGSRPPSSAPLKTFSRVRRDGPRATPSSTLRGYPEVDTLLLSPGQRFLFVCCRSKRRASLYRQSNEVAFMSKGKELGDERFFTSVDGAVQTALGVERKVEVYSAAFTPDDTRLIVGERASDTFLCFAVSSAAGLSLLWQFKMPGQRLVSSLPMWGPMGQDALLCHYNHECEVERITRYGVCSKEKFKVGSATAWAQWDDQIAVAGSFLREPRLAKVGARGDAIALNLVHTFPNPDKLRVMAMAFVMKGSPEFNTRSYLIVFLENGVGTVYDLASMATRNIPDVVCTFADTQYAGYISDEPLTLITAVGGKAYQEVLKVGLVRGGDVTVYSQEGFNLPFHLLRTADLHDVQEGDPVKHAVFLQHGRGVATCGNADGRQVRMFALPS